MLVDRGVGRRALVAALRVGVPLYPNFDSLDVCGPYQTFTIAGMECHLIGPSTDDCVTSWEGVSITPTTTFDSCRDLDMLFVPGGDNVVKNVILKGVLGSNPYLDFLADYARTTWICSVCTGALLLGAAGLLDGHTCTTHWAFKDVLRLFPGVNVVDDYRRHVRSGNRITGAGISSGLDESFYITSLILGLDVARMCQLKMQYHPEPIVHCGDPGDADIRDNPSMVRQVLDDWDVDQAAADVKDWLAGAE
jgi:transcriptional regulator GlxA family with amidase domain